ncbi:MAG: hypothetical protein AABX80_01480 [Nanoarchaeota archaeon]
MEDEFDIRKLSILEIFKDLYPKNKIEEEINPYTKIKLHKTFSIFCNSNSKLPQMYIDEAGYFCFESGQKGFIPNLLIHKFNEEKSETYKKSIDYLLKKYNKILKVNKINNFKKDFEERYIQGFNYYNSIISKESLLANNSCALNDGSWINPFTNKWEGWNLNLEKDV